jgi:hypothetical protein
LPETEGKFKLEPGRLKFEQGRRKGEKQKFGRKGFKDKAPQKTISTVRGANVRRLCGETFMRSALFIFHLSVKNQILFNNPK